MKYDSKATTFGRYSPLTLGHLSTFLKIFDDYEHLTVGVLKNIKRPKLYNKNYDHFFNLCDKNWSKIKKSIHYRAENIYAYRRNT